jgi:hypothetical protein
MSTVTKPQQSSPAPRPGAGPVKSASRTSQPQTEAHFLFDKQNYMWMIGGIALIFIGFLLMSGGKSANPHEFHYEEIYSFRRITLAPIVVMLGFIIEVYAIMRKPTDEQSAPIA